MNRNIFVILFVLVFCSFGLAKSYRLLGENYLDVGNRWEYQAHVTKWPGYGNVNWWGTSVDEVTRNQNVSGYSTALVESTVSVSQIGTRSVNSNHFMDGSFLKEVRANNFDHTYVLRSNNPLENLPVWINESDDDRHLGSGYFTGELKDPEYAGFTWDSYTDIYVTFLRIETITVPAGTFDCVVVGMYTETHDSIMGYDVWDSSDQRVWLNPAIGLIKSTEYFTSWDPIDQVESVGEASLELTNSNVTYREDFNGDLEVNLEDLAILAGAWLAGPGDAEWNPACDLVADDIINLKDFNAFVN